MKRCFVPVKQQFFHQQQPCSYPQQQELGPDQVLVVAGMNKVAVDEKTAVLRVQNIASPANTVRLKQNTPCAKTGKCHHCLVDDCICSHTVITRRSNRPDRIHVILIGEELGY